MDVTNVATANKKPNMDISNQSSILNMLRPPAIKEP